ncbi:MAG: hypothetical protein ACKVQU_33975 [Burkholderiales bacterium]
MANGITTMNGKDDDELMNYLVRMVVPMRREFRRQLDVQQFLHDYAYAREVLNQAMTSSDARLLEYARYLETRLHGPRIADRPASDDRKFANPLTPRAGRIADPAASTSASMPLTEAAPTLAEPTEQELRDRVLKKYTRGLR